MPGLCEDLVSVLVRTAQLMGYPQPSWILHPERAGHSISKDALPLLAKQLDYDLPSRLLNLDETILYNMTLHRFAERTTVPYPKTHNSGFLVSKTLPMR
ncbi:MAG: hypothetical protein ACXVCM_16550 [Ktedonobacteraceae bacterium]